MKSLIALSMLISFNSFASFEDVVCYSDMGDQDCKLTETKTSYKGRCTIDITLTYKNGEVVPTVIEGNSSLNKNSYAMFLNNDLKEKTIVEANVDLFQKIKPFFSMETCK